MYPRAEAYIISVKQSTYCQFGEVIRAHTERGEGGWGDKGSKCWVEGGRWKKRKSRQEMAEEVRKNRSKRMLENLKWVHLRMLLLKK